MFEITDAERPALTPDTRVQCRECYVLQPVAEAEGLTNTIDPRWVLARCAVCRRITVHNIVVPSSPQEG